MNIFYDNKNIYSVDMMISYIHKFKNGYNSNKFDIAKNIDVLGDQVWTYKKVYISPYDVISHQQKYLFHWERILNAQLKYPIIMYKNIIIDGYHRFTKATILKKSKIKVYEISEKLMTKFIIGKRDKQDKIEKMSCWDIVDLFQQRFL